MGEGVPEQAVWIDLLHPNSDQLTTVGAAMGIDLPSREDMLEIEESSRLSARNGVLMMTAAVLINSDGPSPQTTPITFVLAAGRLATLRYGTPRAFETFPLNADQYESGNTAFGLMLSLLDAIIDRAADILERVQADMDRLSHSVFTVPDSKADKPQEFRFRVLLRRIGRAQMLTMKARESLTSIQRLIMYASRPTERRGLTEAQGGDEKSRLKTLARDVSTLLDHAGYLSHTITFLLDATLGLLTVEQNSVIKVLSVATLLFLPPAVVAGIYGMNFEIMPELSWPWGYPMALGLMLLSAVLPYLFFKRRGWL